MATSKPGIYVCGMFQSPKDIPDTMVQASAAASNASRDLTPLRVGRNGRRNAPERRVAGEEPRIGVFVCECGVNIGGVVSVEKVAENAGLLPQVVVSETIGHGCSLDALEWIEEPSARTN